MSISAAATIFSFLSLRPHCFSSSARRHSPDSTTKKSPSLLPHVRLFADDASVCRLMKEEKREELVDDNRDESREGAASKLLQPEQISSKKVENARQNAFSEKVFRDAPLKPGTLYRFSPLTVAAPAQSPPPLLLFGFPSA